MCSLAISSQAELDQGIADGASSFNVRESIPLRIDTERVTLNIFGDASPVIETCCRSRPVGAVGFKPTGRRVRTGRTIPSARDQLRNVFFPP